MSAINRSQVSRALAKAIAYKECGKDAHADLWACELVRLLQCTDILLPERKPVGAETAR